MTEENPVPTRKNAPEIPQSQGSSREFGSMALGARRPVFEDGNHSPVPRDEGIGLM